MRRRESTASSPLRPLPLILCVAVLTMLYMAAQNVGDRATEYHRDAYFVSSQRKLELSQQQLQACRVSLEDSQLKIASAPEVLRSTMTEVDTVSKSIAASTEQTSNARKLLKECEERLDKLKVAVIGTGDSSTDSALDALRRKERMLMEALAMLRNVVDPQEHNATHAEDADLPHVLTWFNAQLATQSRRPDGAAALCKAYSQSQRYSVVFDIGSTGNRIHVYKFISEGARHASSVWDMTLSSELFEFNHVPMSEQTTPEAILGALNGLFKAGLASIPVEYQRCTPLEFKATAGLRKAGLKRASETLGTIRAHYATASPLWLRGEHPARILEGSEEGPLAWLTVNYLLGRFQSTSDGKTAAIIDLGGGSTQIVMEPGEGRMPASMDERSLYRTRVNGRPVVAYQHSYEGLGLHEGTRELLMEVQGKCAGEVHHKHLYTLAPAAAGDGGLDDDDETAKAGERTAGRGKTGAAADGGGVSQVPHPPNATAMRHFPCFAVGYSDAMGVQHEARTAEGGASPSTVVQGANFFDCVALVRDYVLGVPAAADCPSQDCGMRGQRQPSLATFDGPIYAFSFIHDLMYTHRANKATEDMTLAEMGTIGAARCAALTLQTIADAQAAGTKSSLKPPYECMYYSYVYALLRYGYGIPEGRKLTIAKKINGFETAWTLGAALISLSS